MKIVFLSNYYNHHQRYLSKKLYELTNGNYKFVAYTGVPESRKKLGYSDLKDDFVLSYNDEKDKIQAIIDSADIVICGSSPESWIENRKKQGKVIFRYSERPLKKGLQLWKYPYRFFRLHKQNPPHSNIYMLCASAYTKSDYAKFGLFQERCFKWGYFPECKRYEDIETLISHKVQNEILWCGRFLNWKHPDDILKVARRLKSDGYSFHISIIGTGEMEDDLKAMSDEYNLFGYVTFVGAVSADKVREYMENAAIYLFTSDRQEGWGVVLNEAMNSGCAIVASDAAGATPYLIENGENGIIYQLGDFDNLYQTVQKLLSEHELRVKLGKNAYETITNEWNADIAAGRLITLSEHLLSNGNGDGLYQTGLCSKA